MSRRFLLLLSIAAATTSCNASSPAPARTGARTAARRDPAPRAPVPAPAPYYEPLPTIDPRDRTWGPLASSHSVTATPQDERQQASRRNEARLLTRAELDADIAALEAIADLLPRTAEERIGLERTRNTLAIARRLAPESVSSLCNGLIGTGDAICPRPPGEMWHCDPYVIPQPAPVSPEPYRIDPPRDGIARLTISSLSNSTHPAWARFLAAAEPLTRAKGVVIDMRFASGDDPRALIPWLEALTGTSSLAPLRAIRQPAPLRPYVEAYRARYIDESRRAELWTALVGAAQRPRPNPDARHIPPIAVVVGVHCGPACELVARVLEARAGATIVGGVGASSRLYRDDPAVLTLPNSRIGIYFFATEYLLATDIEEKTGPTWKWRYAIDPVDFDGNAYATTVVRKRAASPDWPARCDSYPVYPAGRAMPAAFSSKVNDGAFAPSCSDGYLSLRITTDLPYSAMQRLLDTCPNAPTLWNQPPRDFKMDLTDGAAGLALVSRLAQSDAVRSMWITCNWSHPEPNGGGDQPH